MGELPDPSVSFDFVEGAGRDFVSQDDPFDARRETPGSVLGGGGTGFAGPVADGAINPPELGLPVGIMGGAGVIEGDPG